MEDKWDIKKVPESQRDVHEKVVNQSNLELTSLSPTWSPGPSHIQIDVHIAYDLRFRCSTYAWKAKKITFLVEPISCQTKITVVHNHKKVLISRTIFVLQYHFGPMGRVSSWSPLGTCPRVQP
jgi:hypothetical protein